MIVKTKTFTVTCDAANCFALERAKAHDQNVMIQHVRTLGWKIALGGDFCPKHAAKGGSENERPGS